MATNVTYTCDRCNKSDTKLKLWEVSIGCEPIGDYAYRMQFHTIIKRQKAEWCESCIKEMNIFVPLHRADIEQKGPTIEDIIREIVREENNGRS
jgi:hypothetical protein